MSCRSGERLGEVASEIEDRYGHPPDPVKAAFEVMRLRMTGRKFGFEKVDGKGGRLSVSFENRAAIPPRVLSIVVGRRRDAYVTREALIWPYAGDPLAACRAMLDTFGSASEQAEREREELGLG
jgi:transcription-repair coupling factor (superfamily II helicase)